MKQDFALLITRRVQTDELEIKVEQDVLTKFLNAFQDKVIDILFDKTIKRCTLLTFQKENKRPVCKHLFYNLFFVFFLKGDLLNSACFIENK